MEGGSGKATNSLDTHGERSRFLMLPVPILENAPELRPLRDTSFASVSIFLAGEMEFWLHGGGDQVLFPPSILVTLSPAAMSSDFVEPGRRNIPDP